MADTKTFSTATYTSLTSEHRIAQAFWIGTFALLTAIGAQIEIPLQPVPFTLQTLFVLLAGASLGKRNGFMSMALYLAIGVGGLPVFSGGGFGLARILGPTGGYLLAFPMAAFVVGYLVSLKPFKSEREGKARIFMSYAWSFVAMIAGLLIIFSLGTIQLNYVYFNDWPASFSAGFLIFSWWDLLKLIAAVAIYRQIANRRH